MKKLIIPALLIVGAIALVVIFSERQVVIDNRLGGSSHVVRHSDRVTLDAEDAHRSSLRRERSRTLEGERKAALDLAGKIVENFFSPPRMLYEGEERVPSVLMMEAKDMKVAQLRVLVLELGANHALSGSDRALLVAEVTDAWLLEHEAGRTQALKQVLDIIGEVLPTLPQGFDTLAVSCAMGRSLEWDPLMWTDFIEAHWSRWSGPNGNGNAEVMRRDLLKVLEDPQLRMRVKKLPPAGRGN